MHQKNRSLNRFRQADGRGDGGHGSPTSGERDQLPNAQGFKKQRNHNVTTRSLLPRQTQVNIHSPSTSPSPSQDQPLNALANGTVGRHGSNRLPTPDIAVTRGIGNWALAQETKIKVFRIPRGCWTKDVYEAFSRYGTIVRIEMQKGAVDSIAWVSFQPPLNRSIRNWAINVTLGPVRIEMQVPRLFTIKSPLNPGKNYNEFNIINGNTIDFGIRVAETTMMVMHSVNAPNNVRMTLNLQRKEIDVHFPLSLGGETRKVRFRLPISLLQHIDKSINRSTGQCTLAIPFDSPPQFFMQLEETAISNSCKSSDRIWLDWYSWNRQTDIVTSPNRAALQSQPLMSHKDTAVIDIGRWTTYRLSFDIEKLSGPQFLEFTDALADHGITTRDAVVNTFEEKSASPLANILQEEVSATHAHFRPSSHGSTFDELTSQVTLRFPVRYQLEVCLSNGYLKEHNITREFLERVAHTDPAHIIYILEKVASKQQVYYDPMDIFEIRPKGDSTKKVPNYCVLARSAIITPTMIHVSTPVVETSNRIIRKHAADAERFIRVKFSDEKTEGRIHGQDNDRSEALFDRIRCAMKNGIVVAGRFYQFLAFGNSQFREHGAYFYAPTASVSAEQIRHSMGQFDHIKTVAKFGARLGQCFSTTRPIRSLKVTTIRIPDIERNGSNFSDGVGKLSSFLAQMAATELGLHNPFEDPPSLFQFRLGGCKGVLALDPTVTKNEVHIRPSQTKFEATEDFLEIVRASAFATACFNRQLIIVLSTLGVPDYAFIKQQQEMVNDLERATKDESVALEKLQRYIDFNHTTLTLSAMILDGFMKSREPFMMSLLQLWRAYNIKFLKEKARIIIEKGAFVLGCVDETATLQGHYDDPQSRPDATRDEKLAVLPEIFLQISDTEKKGHYKVIEGICILARNPSLHAGDIRVVRAVDIPVLHHMKNVVVIPQTGDRDIANMCSGGDLDGDDYLVMWDNNFLPKTINEPPMDFTPEKPVDLDRPVTIDDVVEFFVTYMKNDSLSRIALAHLAQADFNAEGVRDEKCLELAKLHSQAVDYNKSGIPAVMDRSLRPFKFPHFMENKYRQEHHIYKSKKILGMLYDQVQLVDFKPQYENAFDHRILGAFELDEKILGAAAELKSSYDAAIRRLMAKHEIRTEFEAWSVFVLSHNQETRDYSFAEEFGNTVGILKSQFRETCVAAAGACGPSDSAKMGPFVAAMYAVTARETQEALDECRTTKMVGGQSVPVRKMEPEEMPLMSFPWLFVNELGKIATEHNTNGPSVKAGNVKTNKEEMMHYEMKKLDLSQALGLEGKGLRITAKESSPAVASSSSPNTKPYTWKQVDA
ncbi:RNA dependent RNA polymerase-domain-containing protein [Massariosphaeria phaeospora]|uniref:RNA-dependent RNA polymerase n=1 Tax=Massariosphaeria phaeospora TaxID=100035 RepID=A0A7C8M985_9PLEO|nr:RNA dependent RNA polymerase-domain-containing protein [Massariosphaeria phaeospora]